jgi:arylsulfatase A-like enzyme
MLRRQFLGQHLPATLAGSGWAWSQPERPPNVVLLIADGWRGQALPFAGDSYAVAPNLERLRADGVWLRRAYTPNPEAAPGKAAILTGLYPHMTGVLGEGDALPVSEPSLAGWLANAGYATTRIGRRRLGPRGVTGGIDEAIEFIRQTWNRPFFLVFELDHSPQPGWQRQDVRFRMPHNVPAADAGGLQRTWRRYYSGLTRMDADTGRVLDTLDETAAGERTLVAFTADRGSLLGAHGLTGDGEPHEEAVRVPLLVRYTERLRPRTLDIPASTLDIAPTVLSLLGQRIPEQVQGRNLSGWLATGDGDRPETVYCQGRLGTEAEWRMVVRGFDKLVVDRDLEATHLFNRIQDPYEMENLIHDKNSRRKRDEMLAVLQHEMRQASDRILPSGLKLRD